MQTKEIEKLVISWTLLLVASYTWLLYSSDSGYHLSIYNQVPRIAVFLAIISMISSILISILFFFDRRARLAIISLGPLYLTLSYLLLLPQLLGYGVLSGDAMLHIGDMRDIVALSTIPNRIVKSNIYPGLHLVTIATSITTNVSLMSTYNLFRLLALLMWICALIPISNYYGIDAYFLLLLSPMTYMAVPNVNPSSIALKLPFVLCVYLGARYIQNSDGRFWPILTLSIISMWLFHPFVSIFLLIGLTIFVSIIIYVSVKMESIAFSISSSMKLIRYNRRPIYVLLIYGFVGITWFTYGARTLLRKAVLTPYHILYSIEKTAQYQPGGGIQETLFDNLGFNYFDLILLTVKMFGEWLIILSIAAVGTILWIIQTMKKNDDMTRLDGLVPIIFILSGIWAIVELWIGVVPAVGYLRISRPALMLAPILCGLLLTEMKGWGPYRRYVRHLSIGIAILVVVGTLIGATGLYGSPWVLSANSFTTASEYEGIDWYVDNTGFDEHTYSLGGVGPRQVDLVVEPPVETKLLLLRSTTQKVPPGYGYGKKETLSASIENGYYVETKRSRIMNSKIGTTPFSQSDYHAINYDYSVTKIYTNGNVNVSQVN